MSPWDATAIESRGGFGRPKSNACSISQIAGFGLLLDRHAHRHLLVERADDEVLPGLRELALEAVVRGRGLRVEALDALRLARREDVVHVPRHLRPLPHQRAVDRHGQLRGREEVVAHLDRLLDRRRCRPPRRGQPQRDDRRPCQHHLRPSPRGPPLVRGEAATARRAPARRAAASPSLSYFVYRSSGAYALARRVRVLEPEPLERRRVRLVRREREAERLGERARVGAVLGRPRAGRERAVARRHVRAAHGVALEAVAAAAAVVDHVAAVEVVAAAAEVVAAHDVVLQRAASANAASPGWSAIRLIAGISLKAASQLPSKRLRSITVSWLPSSSTPTPIGYVRSAAEVSGILNGAP